MYSYQSHDVDARNEDLNVATDTKLIDIDNQESSHIQPRGDHSNPMEDYLQYNSMMTGLSPALESDLAELNETLSPGGVTDLMSHIYKHGADFQDIEYFAYEVDADPDVLSEVVTRVVEGIHTEANTSVQRAGVKNVQKLYAWARCHRNMDLEAAIHSLIDNHHTDAFRVLANQFLVRKRSAWDIKFHMVAFVTTLKKLSLRRGLIVEQGKQ